jgi:hypothetical protein
MDEIANLPQEMQAKFMRARESLVDYMKRRAWDGNLRNSKTSLDFSLLLFILFHDARLALICAAAPLRTLMYEAMA